MTFPPDSLVCMVSLALPVGHGGGEVVEICGVESEDDRHRDDTSPLLIEILPSVPVRRYYSRQYLVGLTPAAREFLREVEL